MNRYHWPFDDPAHLEGPEEGVKREFRRVRDEIKMVTSAYATGVREERTMKV